MDTLKIEKYGFKHTGNIFRNNSPGALVEKALLHKEGRLSRAGALCIETGERTGRSPNDKYIVDTPAVHDLIAWGNVNRPVSREVFDQVYDQIVNYLNDKDLYVFDGFAGANRKYQYGFRVINEKASQNLFIRNLLIRPKKEQLKDFKEDFLILVAPGCKVDYQKLGLNSEAAIMIDFEKQIVQAATCLPYRNTLYHLPASYCMFFIFCIIRCLVSHIDGDGCLLYLPAIALLSGTWL